MLVPLENLVPLLLYIKTFCYLNLWCWEYITFFDATVKFFDGLVKAFFYGGVALAYFAFFVYGEVVPNE